MKILQVNNVYKVGSTGKITYDIHTGLQNNGIESIVCYGRGNIVTDENVYKICGEFYSHLEHLKANVTGLMYGGCELSTYKLIKIIKKEIPDIVHLQCINGYFVNIYKLLQWLKINEIKTVLTLHAEFMYTANCGYAIECNKWMRMCGNCTNYKKCTGSYFFDNTEKSWNYMYEAFESFNNLTVVSVSPWLMNRAKQSPMLKDKNHMVVYNGLDTDVFHLYDTEKIKEELGISKETKVIFHATPSFSMNLNSIKGGYYVVDLAKKMIKENVRFVIAGKYDKDVSYPSNMIMLGNIANQQRLAQLYSMADVTLLTSKKETFSMVCAESLCCGTPIVGFKAGAPEQISIPEYSFFVEHGDMNALFKVLMKILEKEKDKRIIAQRAFEIYTKENMINKYLDIYNNILRRKIR